MDADNSMPTRKKTTNQLCNSMDLISQLPENLMETISMKMPLRDVARTCILSKRFRDSWVKFPHLILDDEFWKELMENQTYHGRAAKFESILFGILLFHQGPITNIKLYIPDLERSPKIDMLVTYVVRNGVQSFSLYKYPAVQRFKLHSSLFTCPTLHSVELRYCEVNFLPSPFERLNNLTKLELFNVTISAQTLERLVSSCPSLHTLRLSLPIDILCLHIISTTLRCFSYYYKSRSQSSLAVNYGQQQQGGILELLGGSPNLEYLHIDDHCVKSLTAGELLTKLSIGMLHHLKSIYLDICLEDVVQFSSVLCLIGSSPNLQKLSVYQNGSTMNNNNMMENLQDDEDYSDLTLDHLVDVEMLSFVGGRLELKFIKILLEKSLSLRKMNISLATEIDRLRIIKQMFMFRRAAPNVEVLIED